MQAQQKNQSNGNFKLKTFTPQTLTENFLLRVRETRILRYGRQKSQTFKGVRC